MDSKFGASWAANFSTLHDFQMCFFLIVFCSHGALNLIWTNMHCAVSSEKQLVNEKTEGALWLPGKLEDRKSHLSDTSLLGPDMYEWRGNPSSYMFRQPITEF